MKMKQTDTDTQKMHVHVHVSLWITPQCMTGRAKNESFYTDPPTIYELERPPG